MIAHPFSSWKVMVLRVEIANGMKSKTFPWRFYKNALKSYFQYIKLSLFLDLILQIVSHCKNHLLYRRCTEYNLCFLITFLSFFPLPWGKKSNFRNFVLDTICIELSTISSNLAIYGVSQRTFLSASWHFFKGRTLFV